MPDDRSEGYGMVWYGMAETVSAGLALFTRYQPDLIFLDIELGHKSGFNLLTQLKDQPYSVIFMTAHEQYGVRPSNSRH